MDINSSTEEQYIMPAEWSHHSATLLIWPHNRSTWPGKRLEAVESVYRQIVLTLLEYEPVVLLVNSKKVEQRVMKILKGYRKKPEALKVLRMPVNDVWARDSGPIAVRENGNTIFTDWEFNSWGGKYAPWEDDNNIPGRLAAEFSVPRVETDIVLEGGSIDINGEGLLITTESVLLNSNRNPELSKEDIEAYLQKYLGAKKIIWLKNGLEGDDTDGHIDDLARFVNNNSIVAAITDNQKDPNYKRLQENFEILQNATGLDGDPLHILPVPLPETYVEDPTVDGSSYVPSSYANFYIANGVVLVPLYDERSDSEVVEMFTRLFPDRIIKGIPCSDLVWGQGSIHCITQQLYGIEL